MAGGVVEGPVQVHLVGGAGDTEGVGIVPTQGNEERALSGQAWMGTEREREREM